MATWGSNPADASEESFDTGGAALSRGTFGPAGGALTDVIFQWGGFAGGASARVTVWQGGTSDANETGATKIFDSGLISGFTTTARAYRSCATDFGKSVSGALAANTRTWICVQNNDGNVSLSNNSTARGDLLTGSKHASFSNNASISPTSPIASAGSGSAEALKAYLVFTPAGGSIVARAQAIYRRRRMG